MSRETLQSQGTHQVKRQALLNLADMVGDAMLRPTITKGSKNRRRAQRSLCSELVRVEYDDQRGRTVNLAGLLEDVGRDGLCISLSLPLRVGAEIRFACDGFFGRASVEYCNLGDYSYLVGAAFLDGLQWDETLWRPRHLLALGEPGQ